MQLTISGTVQLSVTGLMFIPGGPFKAAIGVAFPATPVGQVIGGTAPYTYSAPTGLPAGMTLSPSGQLAGTPTEDINATIGFTITDSTP